MKTATVARGFTRSDTREHVRVGESMTGENGYIDELHRLGLVREVAAIEAAPENKAAPSPAVGVKQSASPAAPVSPQTMCIGSKTGGKRRGRPRKVAESSS